MTDIAVQEVREAVEVMLRNLSPLAEHNPEALVSGEDFNALLVRARAALPQSPAIKELKGIQKSTTLTDLLVKLSILSGAVKATFDDDIRAVRRNDRFHQSLDEFTR